MIIKNRNLSIFGLIKIENNKIININPLKGGVSCEIYKVDTTDKSYCVKKALRKLKVRKNKTRLIYFLNYRSNKLKLLPMKRKKKNK